MELVGWQNGTWRPMSQVGLPVDDLGCLQGVMVVDRLRTVAGQLFDRNAHLARWRMGCEALGISLDANRHHFEDAVLDEVVERNRCYFDNDFGIVVLATPGTRTSGPSVIVHASPIDWQMLSRWYEVGQPLSVARQQAVPDECWPLDVKNRARINYYLADRSARQATSDPTAAGLLLYREGLQSFVTETSSANILIVEQTSAGGWQLVTPPAVQCFSGLSLSRTLRLAASLGMDVKHEAIAVDRAKQCAGIVLTGTTGCLWRASCLDEVRWQVEDNAFNRIYERLCKAWDAELGHNFREQARA